MLKSTGSIDDLFPVEDELAEQARAQLSRIEYAAGRGADTGEPRPTVEPYGPVTMHAYGSPDWADTGPSNIPSAAANRYYYGNPYNWYEFAPAPAYNYPAPNYGGIPYYGGGSVSYSVSRFPIGSAINAGINTPGGGVTPGTVTPGFVSERARARRQVPDRPARRPEPDPRGRPRPEPDGRHHPALFPRPRLPRQDLRSNIGRAEVTGLPPLPRGSETRAEEHAGPRWNHSSRARGLFTARPRGD